MVQVATTQSAERRAKTVTRFPSLMGAGRIGTLELKIVSS